MPSGRTWFWGCGLLLGLWLACAGALAQGDPPGRVGRIAALQGAVWLFEPEQGEWVPALANRPFTEGDRLATAQDASAEVRIGSTTLWLGSQTEIEALRLDDLRLQFRMQRGQMALQLRSDGVAAELEIAHPEVRLQPARAGLYRVDRLAEATDARVWRGALRVEGQNLSMTLQAGQRAAFWREGPLGDVTRQWLTPQDDEFARAVQRQDQAALQGTGSPFVSSELTGAEELQQHGQWQQHPDYGAVWAPLAVAPGWAPYRYGRWVWLRPWGWTWVDDVPWGFPTSHYGRWFLWEQRWYWAPGPVVPRPVFSPGLVGWVGGPPPPVRPGYRPLPPVQGWVPLGPRDPYPPRRYPGPGYWPRPAPGTVLPSPPVLPPAAPGVQPPGQRPPPGLRPPPGSGAVTPAPPATGPTGPFFGRPPQPSTGAASREPLLRPTVPPVAVTVPAPAPARPPAPQAAPAPAAPVAAPPAATTMAPPAAKPAVPSAATAQPQPAFRPPKPEPFTPAPAQPAEAGAQDPRAPGSEPRRQAPASRPPMRER
jgi:hypothetical protein